MRREGRGGREGFPPRCIDSPPLLRLDGAGEERFAVIKSRFARSRTVARESRGKGGWRRGRRDGMCILPMSKHFSHSFTDVITSAGESGHQEIITNGGATPED